MDEINYEAGRAAHRAWVASPQFAQFDKAADPRVVMRLFLPPVPEDGVLISRPLPKPYQEWLRGFTEARDAAR